MSKINIRNYLHPKQEISCSQEIKLTQDLKDEMLEAFTLYDKNGDGLISTKDLGKVIRSLGQVLTVCEETDIVAQYAQEKCYEIDYINFVRLMIDRYKIIDDNDELRESFRRFDREENGFVNVKELKTMLTTIGEALSKDEVEDWLEDAKDHISDGNLHYEDFVTFMLSK